MKSCCATVCRFYKECKVETSGSSRLLLHTSNLILLASSQQQLASNNKGCGFAGL